ncbi:sulfite exporter TauE/SafE family protein [Lysinibacillus sp. JNUCC-52]|uniref:sulfite exporter TauE/SafE family protein n=1 Tax=Lysinibacillus sp. JNUCC-52 TaxID=2792480 RepID=UPI0019376324|nr:sulfite exporter TauE/SafE family protein [Lysinibacillus sp. JNUCC-52]
MVIFLNEWFSVNGLMLFSIGIIAAMIGVMFGAAGFVLLPAMLLVGVPIHATVAVNKFATGISSFTNVLTLLFKKDISLKEILPFMLMACFGGVTGAFLATRLSEQIMNIMACIILTFSFFIVLKNNKKLGIVTEGDQEKRPSSITPFFISMYDGGFGPGSALMNIMYFIKRQHSYVKAVELTRFVMFSSCMSAFVFYYLFGIVDWGIAIPVTAGSILGSHVGMRMVQYIKVKWLQITLPAIFLLLIAQVVRDLLF